MSKEVEKLKTEIERLKKELKKRKKYGLVWEEKPEEVIETCKKKLPVLKEIKSKEIKSMSSHQKFGGGDKFSVYVFSLGDEDFSEEFADLNKKRSPAQQQAVCGVNSAKSRTERSSGAWIKLSPIPERF